MTRNALYATLLAPAVLALGAAQFATAKPAAPSDATLNVAPAAAQQAATRLVVSAAGNEVRYRVRERLAMMELPYDAVGATSAVSGAIALDAQGRLVPAQSKITVNVTGLKSDQERRDGFVQRNLLQTAQHPEVVFQPTEIRGLTGALPASGSRTFQLVGNMTVKGQTRPATWNVTAQFLPDGRVTGKAVTGFKFGDYGIEKPSVGVILSLADEMALEYDFNLVRQANAS